MKQQIINKSNYNQWDGVLGMAMAPVQNGQMINHLRKAKQYYKIDLLVCLLEADDLQYFGIENQFDVCQEIGLRYQHFPIQDMNVPSNVQQFKKIVKLIVEDYLKKGKRVVIHCFGGNGRTGMLVAACFMYQGFTFQQSIFKVRNVRRHAVQTKKQQNFLKQLKFTKADL